MNLDELKTFDDDMKRMFEHYKKLIQQSNFPPIHLQHSSHYPGISPTDVDAKGVYGYQEPEQDEQGTFYGYKVLHSHCASLRCDALVSPRYHAEWIGGELNADIVPSEKTMKGIHFTKRSDHPELNQYRINDRYLHRTYLVKCALSGTIVETEQGFRAEHAQIIGVYDNGNWQSYQDYQERTRTHSNPITYPEYKKAADWKAYWYGDWDTGPNP